MYYMLSNEKLNVQVASTVVFCFDLAYFLTKKDLILGLRALQHQKGTFQRFGILEVLLNNLSVIT